MAGSEFDVLVVGGGHAGVEAAAVACRLGLRTGLVTLSAESIAEMPCNPAIGGIGKGHLVMELDAVGGVQGWAADRSALQFKMLNRSRGPAVWGPRVQCDKEVYARRLRRLILGMRRIEVVLGEVTGLLEVAGEVRGVSLGDGRHLRSRATILTTGTFLGGTLHTGGQKEEGGRFGEPASRGLAAELERFGIELRRFKTGTPPRLDRESIDYDALEIDAGDADPQHFSWRTERVANRVHCWTTRTPAEVREIILDNIERSPLFSGEIDGVGPRYCPSIEDKVVRFPHHEQHTLFLEPETEFGSSMYVNGFSTSLPADVQELALRAVPGFSKVEFLRYGYAVEYDVIKPGQTRNTLELEALPGVYAAGQVLGTSGYEEAAALGFWAGANAALQILGRRRFHLSREKAYMGVLVDDVVHREHVEPYRMLTSRAEHRLRLGIDSVRERLLQDGVELGLVPEAVLEREATRWRRRDEVARELERSRVNPDQATRETIKDEIGVDLRRPTTWAGIVARHDVDWRKAAEYVPALCSLEREDQSIVVAQIRYRGYLERQDREIDRVRRLREVRIPEDFDADAISGLSNEVREAIRRFGPTTLEEAERLPGMTPAAFSVIAAHVAGAIRGAKGRNG